MKLRARLTKEATALTVVFGMAVGSGLMASAVRADDFNLFKRDYLNLNRFGQKTPLYQPGAWRFLSDGPATRYRMNLDTVTAAEKLASEAAGRPVIACKTVVRDTRGHEYTKVALVDCRRRYGTIDVLDTEIGLVAPGVSQFGFVPDWGDRVLAGYFLTAHQRQLKNTSKAPTQPRMQARNVPLPRPAPARSPSVAHAIGAVRQPSFAEHWPASFGTPPNFDALFTPENVGRLNIPAQAGKRGTGPTP